MSPVFISRLLLLLCLTSTLALPAAAQEVSLQWDGRDLRTPMLTLGLKPADALFPIGLTRSPVELLKARPRLADWLGTSWDDRMRESFRASQQHRPGQFAQATSPDSISFLPPLPQPQLKAARDTAGPGSGVLKGTFGNYADIGMIIHGHGEMGGAWNRYKPCDPGLQISCSNSLIPQLKPDVQFGVVVGGTISDRVHVNVDYDQTREFDAANNINVYYQGLEDEVLQRLEVGDVSIRLPASRYITQGIPAGNFGFKATGQFGPVDFQTVYAQQRGDVTTRQFRMGGAGNKTGLVQDETISLDDADYVKGQFFFVADPDSINGAPHFDVVTLRASDARAAVRPAPGEAIEIYRDERPSINNQQQQAQLGYFLADAVMPDGSRKHTGLFRRLEQGKDYVLHPSGLWVMLRAPLRADEALAISYVSERGDTVGTPNAERVPAGTTPTLRLVRGPLAMHQPDLASWKFEMHNVYRVHSSSSVDLSSIQLSISLGQISAGRTFVSTATGPLPYLKLFGLDEEAPANALDIAQVYQPTPASNSSLPQNSGTSGTTISGTYIIFPTMRPFLEPGPVRSANLSADQAKLALGSDANSTIYNDIDPLVRDGAARFRLNLQYRVKIEGLISSFNLGAFGLREGSDKIMIGQKTLTRGTDYNIDYDIGLVTLLDPQSLFATNPDQEIHATWEQKSQFQIAPTSVFGMNARYQLGARGELNFLGLYQAEKTLMSRPQLGVEPGSIFLGGTSGHLDLGGALIDRALSKIPGLRLGGASSLSITGEAAFSMPNPNRRNLAYVDDFEGADALAISPMRRNWFLGSAPKDLSGALQYLPDALLPSNAAQVVWQHDVLSSDGQSTGAVKPSSIDKQIKIAGELPEPVMWLSLGDTARPLTGKRWRSMTTVLSTTGIDLTRSEYLEFYVLAGDDAAGKSIILDLGTVSEDAFYFDKAGQLNGKYDDGTDWGRGILDAEARLAQREIWGPELDARGLWNQQCVGTGAQAGTWGDPDVNCARKNGYLDTEDLDGNGLLDNADDDGAYYRFVVPLDRITQYLVRDKTQTGTAYQLYRIPLREGIAVGGATQSTWRYVKHLRMTLTSSTSRPVDQMLIARMRIVGSRWIKRDVDGVSRGLLSDQKGTSAGSATIEVGPVSKLTDGSEYASPPAVRDQLQDPTQGVGGSAVEFNEKGLRIRYDAVGADQRAEVYYRYPQQPRSFMNYRELRMWAVAKRGSFGNTGTQKLIIKIGTDARNYYLYQSKLNQELGQRAATPADWQPELVLDFKKWFDLKAQAELALLRGELTPSAPGQPYVMFSEDSTYAIVFEDRARAPNLAAIREVAFGVYNGSNADASGEVWLNDLRLGTPFKDGGVAGNITMDLHGGDFLTSNITFANQGAMFRQLNQDASYVGRGDLSISTTAQLGQLLPAGWGVDMPISISHSRSAQDPTLLEASDVQAAQLPGLRESAVSSTRLAVSLRKRTPSANPIVSALIDGMALRFGYNKGNSSAITLENQVSGFDGALTYSREIKPHDVDIIPGFLEAALRFLAPSVLEKSGFFQRVTGARLRYTPVRIAFSSSFFGQEQRAYQYSTILVRDSDRFVVPIESPRRTLDSDAAINFQPFNSLSADVTLRSSRDLLPASRATKGIYERIAIEQAHSRVGGWDAGWETNRSLTSNLNFRPTVSEWLRPTITMTTRFGTDRSASYLELITVGADTTAILQRRFDADRQLRRQLEFQPFGLLRALTKDTTGLVGLLGDAVHALLPITVSWNSSLGSQFDRNSSTPRFAYQLALGDLERFRFMGVDSAVTATETGRFDVGTSVRLPKSAQIDFQYASADLQAFDQRGGSRNEHERTWPQVRMNWNDVPLPGLVKPVIASMGVSSSYQVRTREQALGTGAQSDRGGRDVTVPFSARMSLRGGVVTSYSGSWSSGTSDDPTGDAEQGGLSHNLSFTVTVKPPKSMQEKLSEPMRATVGLTQSTTHQCRYRTIISTDATNNECISFVDFRNRGFNVTLDTTIRDLIVGMQMGYTSRQDFIGTRRGNSQFQLSVFANFQLPVGTLPSNSGSGGFGGVR